MGQMETKKRKCSGIHTKLGFVTPKAVYSSRFFGDFSYFPSSAELEYGGKRQMRNGGGEEEGLLSDSGKKKEK